MSFTVLSYNIERGFHSRNHHLEEERLHAAQRVVHEVKPDILALTEACYGGPNAQGLVMDYQQLFGFAYGAFAGYSNFGSRKGDEGGNCLLSRLPMESEAISLAYKSAVRGRVKLEDKILTIDVVHPSYSIDDAEKIRTLAPLLAMRKEPYILTGDFNTVHPEDTYDWDALLHELQQFNPEKAEQVIKNWQHPELIPWLLSLGLRDAFPPEKRMSTVPTLHAYGEPRTGVRMDFFFVSPEIRVIDAYVLKNSDTEIASDHYPIVGVFDVR